MPEANLIVAAFLCGLIWTIQLVHYPLFAAVGRDAWPAYEDEHRRRITPLVLPVMAANVVLAVLLVAQEHSAARVLNLALAGSLFVATGAVFGRMHVRLTEAWDDALHRRLVRLNWLRTAGWTAQVAVAVVVAA